jgi:hypothetical protein
MLGEIVLETNQIFDETAIDLSSQKNAIYFVTCFDGNSTKRFKIFKL